MISFPNAKINLGLNILSKRTDGYHEIESCIYPIDWSDSLEIIESNNFSFNSYGLEIPGDIHSNLCVKAYKLLQAEFGIPEIEIHLVKSIPMGAGLGGGSSDGAFMLKMLNEFFGLHISNNKLKEYAFQLGSDCAFFIENMPQIASGRGEVLKSINLDLNGYCIALENPGIHIPTNEAYSMVETNPLELSIVEVLERPITEWRDSLSNRFENPIFNSYPEIMNLKKEMYRAGALYVSMTGSGSTVYGIFEKKPASYDWKIFDL